MDDIDNGIYLKIYEQIATWIPEGHEIILAEDRFDYMGFDSIDSLELIMWSEEEFGIEISDAKWCAAKIETVGEFAEFIESIIKEV